MNNLRKFAALALAALATACSGGEEKDPSQQVAGDPTAANRIKADTWYGDWTGEAGKLDASSVFHFTITRNKIITIDILANNSVVETGRGTFSFKENGEISGNIEKISPADGYLKKWETFEIVRESGKYYIKNSPDEKILITK